MFAMIFAALLVGHYLGDYFVQTDVQAQHKGRRGSPEENRAGRWHCFWHALTYTITLATALHVALMVEGVEDTPQAVIVVWSALLLNGATHYLIDRRWPLEAFERFTGHSRWIDSDPEALPKLDQAAHIVLLGVFAFAIAALI